MPETLEGTLARELDPNKPPQIEFKLNGATIRVPSPLTMQTCLWIMEHPPILLDPNEPLTKDTVLAGVLRGVAIEAKLLLSVATGVKLDELEALDAAEYDHICELLMEQVRGEMQNIAPFSDVNFEHAAKAYSRTLILAGIRQASPGGTPPLPSNLNTAEVDGTK